MRHASPHSFLLGLFLCVFGGICGLFGAQCNSRGRDLIKGNHCPHMWSGFCSQKNTFINDRMLLQAVF